MSARGIPHPRPDLKSLHATVVAMKEAVESELQTVRDKTLDVSAADRLNPRTLVKRVAELEKRLTDAGI